MPPAGPFLSDEKGAKESAGKGDSDFPLPCTHPLKTTNQGGFGPPDWSFRRRRRSPWQSLPGVKQLLHRHAQSVGDVQQFR